MSNIKIIAVVGSLRQDSVNMKLFNAIKTLAPEGVDMSLLDISNLPMFNQDHEADPPQEVKELKSKIETADGVLFVTPEHNRSFTSVIKNAMDWGSRPWGNNSWDAKPSAVTGATGGPTGTFGAQHQLRQVAVGINLYMMANPQVYFGGAYDKFDEAGKLSDKDSEAILSSFIDAFVNWVKIFKK